MSKERNLNYRNSDNKAKRIGWGKRKEDTILREGVHCNAVFLSQETAEEFEKLFVENEVLKDSVAGLQKKYRNVAETNEVGEGKHLHSCFNRGISVSWTQVIEWRKRKKQTG